MTWGAASAISNAADGWTRIATENSSFSVSGTQTVRYGSGDATPITTEEFDPAYGGQFLVGFIGGEAVACGGFRCIHRTGDLCLFDAGRFDC